MLPGEGGLALSRRVDAARSEDSGVESYALTLASAIDWGFRQVRLIHEARAESTEEFNRSITRVPTFTEGDDVYLLDPRADTRTGGHTLPAFVHPYVGPYRVMKRVGPTAYLVRGYIKGAPVGMQRTTHFSRMRPYVGAPPAGASASTPDASMADASVDTVATPASTAMPAALEPMFTPVQPADALYDPTPALDGPTPASTIGATVHSRHRRKYRPNYTENAKIPLHVPRPGDRASRRRRRR